MNRINTATNHCYGLTKISFVRQLQRDVSLRFLSNTTCPFLGKYLTLSSIPPSFIVTESALPDKLV